MVGFFQKSLSYFRHESNYYAAQWLVVSGFSSIFIIIFFAIFANFSYSQLMNDPATTINFNPFIGIISMLGLFFWASAIGSSLVAHMVLNYVHGTYAERQFFLFMALLTMVLLLDDAFLLHEEIFPKILGIGERYVKTTYLIFGTLFGIAFFRILEGCNALLLAASAAFFMMSLLLDNPAFIHGSGLEGNDAVLYLAEDGAKFVGIVIWSTFVMKTARDVLLKRVQTPRSSVAI